jgi:shikimate kinase
VARSVVLIGPMGAGKTTFGKKLAKSFGVPFVDTDKLIASKHGPITKLFSSKGEEHFRMLEEQVLAAALDIAGIVATGGGVVLRETNQRALARHFVVFLDTDQESVIGKVNLDRRPLLKENPDEWGRIYTERLPLYTRLADAKVFTGNRPIREIMRELEEVVSGKFV